MSDFGTIRNKVESLRNRAAKAEGALEQIQATLKQEFNCSSIEEAEEHLDNLQQEKVRLQKKFDKLLADFINEHGAALGIDHD